MHVDAHTVTIDQFQPEGFPWKFLLQLLLLDNLRLLPRCVLFFPVIIIGISIHMKLLFIVLSPAAASMLPMSRIMVSQKFTYSPGLRDPALRGNRLSLSINRSIHQGIDHQF